MITLLFIPSLLFSDLITFKVGYFFPRAKSDLWTSEMAHLTFAKSSFQNWSFYLGYEFFLSKKIGLAINLEGFSKVVSGIYKVDRVYSGQDEESRNVVLVVPSDRYKDPRLKHEFRVGITPIMVSAKFCPMGRRSGFIPFLGGGIGLYFWSVGVKGVWIDFNDEHIYYDEDIDEDISAYLVDSKVESENKVTIGYHLLGGFMLPVEKKLTLDLEFKHRFAKGRFSEFFSSFGSFDIGGFQISIGLNYMF